jgi:hypothetical protein
MKVRGSKLSPELVACRGKARHQQDADRLVVYLSGSKVWCTRSRVGCRSGTLRHGRWGLTLVAIFPPEDMPRTSHAGCCRGADARSGERAVFLNAVTRVMFRSGATSARMECRPAIPGEQSLMGGSRSVEVDVSG